MPASPERRLLCVLLCFTLLLPAPIALADGAGPGPSTGDAAPSAEEKFFELEDAVVSLATKQPARSSEVPSIVTVIGADQIRQHDYRSVGEALRWVPGFYDLNDMVFDNFGVRGVNAGARGGSRILKVLLDGQPTAFRSTTANFLGPELIPMSAVKKIEVVRGPGSALYGANAFLGVVNVVTKSGVEFVDHPKPKPDEDVFHSADGMPRRSGAGGQLAATGEYIETSKRFGGGVEAAGGGATGGLEAMATASTWHVDRSGTRLPDTSPFYTAQLAANRVDSDHDLAQPTSFYSRESYQTEGAGKFTLHGGLQHLDSNSEFQDLGALPFLGEPPNTTPVHSRQQLNNGFMRALHEGKWGELGNPVETNVSVAYAAGGPDANDKFDTGQPTQFFQREYGYESFDLTSSVAHRFADLVHVTLGLDHTMDFHSELTYVGQDRVTGERADLQFRRTVSINNTGIYGQAIVTPIGPISLTGGVRYDHTTIPTVGIYDEVTGRGGLVWKIAEGLVKNDEKEKDSLTLKLLFGTSYQAPGPELLFGKISQAGDITSNSIFAPQYAYSYEAQLGYHSNAFGLSANTFFNKIENLAVFQKNGLNLQAQNIPEVDSYGFELEASVAWKDLGFRASTGYQRTLQADGTPRSPTQVFPSREQTLFPRWIVSFGPSYRFPDALGGVILSWDNQWVDSRRASTSNTVVNEAPYELDAYFLSTVTLSTPDLKFGASGGLSGFGMFQVVDLLNERYADPGFNGVDFPSLGRRYVVTVGLKF